MIKIESHIELQSDNHVLGLINGGMQRKAKRGNTKSKITPAAR